MRFILSAYAMLVVWGFAAYILHAKAHVPNFILFPVGIWTGYAICAFLCGKVMMPQKNDTMPFGKHKNEPFADIPVSYLDWLIGEAFMDEGRNIDLKKRIIEHLHTRPEWNEMDDD